MRVSGRSVFLGLHIALDIALKIPLLRHMECACYPVLNMLVLRHMECACYPVLNMLVLRHMECACYFSVPAALESDHSICLHFGDLQDVALDADRGPLIS